MSERIKFWIAVGLVALNIYVAGCNTVRGVTKGLYMDVDYATRELEAVQEK